MNYYLNPIKQHIDCLNINKSTLTIKFLYHLLSSQQNNNFDIENPLNLFLNKSMKPLNTEFELSSIYNWPINMANKLNNIGTTNNKYRCKWSVLFFKIVIKPHPINELKVYVAMIIPCFRVLPSNFEFSDTYDITPIQNIFRPTYNPGITAVKMILNVEVQYQKLFTKYNPSVKICPMIVINNDF
ncbi:hypothetical protein AGLY_010967 [Aphis glycines]|uniref:Uncharacterized protein n=1 Tax=Aphis glycines TaxID=307491 RepID=A0A6G0TD10_APHGL|nr:hypothetical protein AGLY_010967 [Aphis glycines]